MKKHKFTKKDLKNLTVIWRNKVYLWNKDSFHPDYNSISLLRELNGDKNIFFSKEFLNTVRKTILENRFKRLIKDL